MLQLWYSKGRFLRWCAFTSSHRQVSCVSPVYAPSPSPLQSLQLSVKLLPSPPTSRGSYAELAWVGSCVCWGGSELVGGKSIGTVAFLMEPWGMEEGLQPFSQLPAFIFLNSSAAPVTSIAWAGLGRSGLLECSHTAGAPWGSPCTYFLPGSTAHSVDTLPSWHAEGVLLMK